MNNSNRNNLKRSDIFLASESPQRSAILMELGITFQTLPMAVDEVTLEKPADTVAANARLKTIAALAAIPARGIVIAADTVLFAQGRILGKPKDCLSAKQYLLTLSGKKVRAYSGVAVACKSKHIGFLAIEYADVQIKRLSEAEIMWYVETEEPLSRAGAFGISRYGELFVEQTSGSHSCLSGLPKAALLLALASIGSPAGSIIKYPPLISLQNPRISISKMQLNY